MAECATSQVAIQRFKLKMIIATIIHLEILEEDGKRENKRGKTRGWTRRREEELMIEATPGYTRLLQVTPVHREMMRMTHDDFLEILMLVEPACILLQ